MLDKDEMKVCNYCGLPLIWTFHWAYKEYFCINCDRHWGMLGAGKTVKETHELKIREKRFRKLWKALNHYLVPQGSYARRGCDKCQGCNHREHLSKKEIRENKIASKILKSLEGCFSDYEE